MSDTDRFMKKVNKQRNGCWLWVGSIGSDGYGVFRIGSRTDGTRKTVRAHRYSYEIYNGKIPNKKLVCHSCDIPSCVNPSHLWIGTHKDNSIDARSKNRIKVPSLKGCDHPNAKLNESSVKNIRHLHKTTGLSHSVIAKMFNVSRSTITLILQRKLWMHL